MILKRKHDINRKQNQNFHIDRRLKFIVLKKGREHHNFKTKSHFREN